MKVLYLAAECKPFAKTGGVGDVAGELPLAIKKVNKEIEIEIVIPFYGKINLDKNIKRINKYNILFHGKNEIAEVFTTDFKEIKINFIKNKTYFEGDYSEPYMNSKNIAFYDDILRFSFFSRVCLQLVKDKNPDIVHANDWVLGYLFGLMEIEKLPQKRILTVHNITYQGNIGNETIKGWEIEKILKNKRIGKLFMDPRKRWSSVNALRLGLELSDMANTVSENYCKEITKPEDQSSYFEGGKGLHQIAKSLYDKKKLIGILNGYEYSFEPSTDKFQEILKEKAKIKKILARKFANPNNFLLGFVGRAVEQKFKLLTERVKGKSVLDHLLNIDGVNIAFLAIGLPQYEEFLRQFIGRPNLSVQIAFDKEKAKQISLGSDVFLMPNLFEPCGITQMESLSNATPPLVRWTGGLTDTVIQHTFSNGTGFGFDGNSQEEVLINLIKVVKDALLLYKNNKSKFRDLQLRGFNERFLWSTSAKRYVKELYESVLKNN